MRVVSALFSSCLAFSLMVATGAAAFGKTPPAPLPGAVPSPAPVNTRAFTYKGYVRSYDFTRQNASANTAGVNQQSFNAALSLHGDYRFKASGFSLDASYLYANPLNNCTSARSHLSQPCGKNTAPSLNPDDTLPGFALSTFYEAYVGYTDANTSGKAGYQVINTPWANASDSRLKPVAFLGGDVAYKFSDIWRGEAGYFNGFEDRASSRFLNSTLLTYNPVDAPGQKSLVAIKNSNPIGVTTNGGFYYARAGAVANGLTTNLHYYAFSDIANALWFDAKYAPQSGYKPFVAAQWGTESSSGKALVGIINSQVFGLQAGASPISHVTVTLGYDHVPAKTATVAGSCPANHAVSANKGLANYFLPASGTPDCVPGPTAGTMTVYYGGWASPYTDSYATDPLFTTSISQGMADRRAFGDSNKVAVSFVSSNRQLSATTSRALYWYGNDTVGTSPTQETDFDVQYFLDKMPKSGPYKGFSIRYRYAERTQKFTYAGGLPLFKYNRFQAEYDF